MGHCAEGCRDVQEDQNTVVARIGSDEESIGILIFHNECPGILIAIIIAVLIAIMLAMMMEELSRH